MEAIPGLNDVRAAAVRIRAVVERTPVQTSTALDRLVHAQIFCKCENLQRSGAFKIRGAANAVALLSSAAAARGVVTHSSGNHAAALALAAQLRGIPAHIIVPEGASATKVAAVENYGARLIRCSPTLADREATAARIAAETGAELVHPYNDVRVIAGQGTVALEFLEQVPELDVLVVPVSGGGLLSGCAIAAMALRPRMRVIGVEPAGADDAARSLRAGEIVREPEPNTMCDGLRAFLGPLTFAAIRQHVHDIVTVTDEETEAAMKLLHQHFHLVVEPSAAVTLAAVLGRKLPATATRIGLVLSGGNVDRARFPWLDRP